MSRVEKIAKNYSGEVLNQGMTALCSFIGRTVFIRMLGTEYLGISGLYTNVLSILSLTDLGIGSSIVFSLYKPLRDKNEGKIYALMNLYKKVYRIIGCCVAFLGCLLMPLLPRLMNGGTELVNIYVVYLIYLTQSVASYLFLAYHMSIIQADQKSYILSIINSVNSIITTIVQIVVLILTRNYILYLLVALATNILKNVVIGIVSWKMYPYLRKKLPDKLSDQEVGTIFKNSGALMIYRVNSTVMNACDNLVLSSFLGLNIVGLYSNYLIFSKNFTNFINNIFSSMKASVGDLHAEGNSEREYQIFLSCNFMGAVIYGIAAVGLAVIANDVITVWIGSQYIISDVLPVLLAISMYLAGIQHINSIFRDAAGLFQQAKYRPLFATIINVSLSIFLVKDYGIHGVVAATVISQMATYLWFDPIILCKYAFEISSAKYFKRNAAYAAVLIFAGILTYMVKIMLNIPILIRIGVEILVCVGSILAMFFGIWGRTEEANYLKCTVMKRIMRTKR